MHWCSQWPFTEAINKSNNDQFYKRYIDDNWQIKYIFDFGDNTDLSG